MLSDCSIFRPSRLLFVAFLSAVLMPCWAQAAPTAVEVMANADRMNRPKYEISTMRMEVQHLLL